MSKKEKLEAAQPSPPSKDGGQEDYEADNALRDIERAEEHKQNKELMARVHKKAGRKLKALSGLVAKPGQGKLKVKSVADIRKARDNVAKGKDGLEG